MIFFEILLIILWPWTALLFLAWKWLNCFLTTETLSQELCKLKAELSTITWQCEDWKKRYQNDEARKSLKQKVAHQESLIEELEGKIKTLKEQRNILRKNSAKSLSEIINLKPKQSKEVSR